jgi:FKBP-type peptidyl-prolyl cis-trans isomerase SlyD
MTDNQIIADGKVVSIAYILTVDGQEVERADVDEPIDYLQGAGNIVMGLEEALAGRKVGEHFSVTIPPEKGYGNYDPDDLERVSRRDMPDAHQLKPGMLVEMEDEEGFIYEAVVKEITKTEVVLDMNPALAGKTLNFEVQVIAIRDADPDELDHGHPHSEFYDEDEYYGDDDDEDFDDIDDEFDGDYYEGEDDGKNGKPK